MREEVEPFEDAMIVYENVRLAMERLRDVENELNSEAFASIHATAEAKQRLEIARDELQALAEILQAMHKRPTEDSSDGVLDAG
jgi:tRNA U34 5-methylaminomethyl-2-thiouridine-forming methyltransferase MnmC